MLGTSHRTRNPICCFPAVERETTQAVTLSQLYRPKLDAPVGSHLWRRYTILTSRDLTSCQRCGTQAYQHVTLSHMSCLHNMLCKELELLCPRTSGLRNLQKRRRNAPHEATDVRDYFRDYFNSSVGSVPWQLAAFRRGRLHSPWRITYKACTYVWETVYL
jgi:hypothetical protein